MKSSISKVAYLVGVVAQNALAAGHQREAIEVCPDVVLDTETNVWENYTLHQNSLYAQKVMAAVANIKEPALQEAASKVAKVGNFVWIDSVTSVPSIDVVATDVPCDHIVGLVVSNLPRRHCSSTETPSNLTSDEATVYQTKFIDIIATKLQNHSSTAFAVIIEPGVLGPLVISGGLPSCADVSQSYRGLVPYALKALNLPNVIMYLDAADGNWLGWDDFLGLGAEELARAYKEAGAPSQLRGFATNVAGWNSWDAAPGEFETTAYSNYNRATNEQRFVKLLAQALDKLEAPNHAISDTSRDGVLGLRLDPKEWCNVNGAGFGPRPTTDTGVDVADALIWAAEGGVSDGSSDPSSATYDDYCGTETAFKPSPEKGKWNQEYFEMLVRNARPSFE